MSIAEREKRLRDRIDDAATHAQISNLGSYEVGNVSEASSAALTSIALSLVAIAEELRLIRLNGVAR